MAAVNPFSEQKKSDALDDSASEMYNDGDTAFIGTNLLDLAENAGYARDLNL